VDAGRRSAAGINLVDVCAAVATVAALQRLLRDTQQAAIGEGWPHCVVAGTWRVLREPCGPRDGVTFFADGSATPRTLRVGPDTVRVDPTGSTATS
jgi:hypothetical protein